jgi:hypothetical protein
LNGELGAHHDPQLFCGIDQLRFCPVRLSRSQWGNMIGTSAFALPAPAVSFPPSLPRLSFPVGKEAFQVQADEYTGQQSGNKREVLL